MTVTAADRTTRDSRTGAPEGELTAALDEFDVELERRRHVCRVLLDAGAPIGVRPLAARVAAREADTTVDALDDDRHRRVIDSLVDADLPALAERGLVEYDERRDAVAPRERLSRAAAPAGARTETEDEAEDHDAEPGTAHAAVAGVSVALLVGLSAGSFAPVQTAALLCGVAGAFVVTMNGIESRESARPPSRGTGG